MIYKKSDSISICMVDSFDSAAGFIVLNNDCDVSIHNQVEAIRKFQ